ncbi:hypothetical protein ACQ3I4_11210 [Zafaria sp. Z1313]|uniref:hypothetical protein n=1 Tax=Zafaria sp. Z1313 TaxID=3423202 RepID=UPI003D303063
MTTPTSIGRHGVTVDCPVCGALHQYGVHALYPWPVASGGTRRIPCPRPGVVPSMFTIEFPDPGNTN